MVKNNFWNNQFRFIVHSSYNKIKIVEDSVDNVTGDGLSLVLCISSIVLLSILLEVELLSTSVFLPGSNAV